MGGAGWCTERGVIKRGKYTYYGKCPCGWIGPERWSFGAASTDLHEHANG